MGMMGIKTGTKTWSEAAQDSSLKTDAKANLSPQELKMLGGENVGETLNKIADPNWVDPSKKIRAVGNDKLDKDAFMKLMLAQMKNQDPTNPLKSHEMAAQLAQFSSLEQLQNMNTSLDQIRNGQKPAETYQALNFIGKAVSGDSAKVLRSKGDKAHTFNFVLPENVQVADIVLKNAEGEVVRKTQLRELKAGDNQWIWNGEGENGLQASTGEYKFSIEAKTSAGKKVGVKTDFDGIITGVNYTPEGPVLLVGDQAVKLKDVKKIVDPDQLRQQQVPPQGKSPVDQNSQNQPSAELKSAPDAAQNKNTGAPEKDETAQGNIMTGVAMNRDMMEKLKKEVGGQ